MNHEDRRYMNGDIVTYEPDNSIKKGIFLIFYEIYREFKQGRYLAYKLFIRDFMSMNKQSLIGVLWIFIIPIFNVAIFIMLSRSGIFNIGTIAVPYPIYAILGLAFWQLFSTGIIASGGALVSAGDMITRINFSKKCLVISTLGKPMISFLMQFFLLAVLLAAYRVVPSKGVFFVPLVIVPILLLTLGIGFIISILNAIVRDTGHLLSIVMTLLMYVTPVLYAKPEFGIISLITKYNPMYYMISAGRDLFLQGIINDMQGFIWSVVGSCILFVLSLVIFHLTETRITERI